MNHTLLRCCAALLLLGLGMFWVSPAHARGVTCTANMTNVVFGTVNPLSSQTNVNATLNYTCSNNARRTRYATVCFSIGAGAQGAGRTNPREMQDSEGNVLRFQLYQDPAHSIVWGSEFIGGLSPLQIDLTIPRRRRRNDGTVSGSATMYGQVISGQTGAIPGNYQDVFSGGDTAITINEDNNAPPGSCSNTTVGSFPFTVTATVTPRCFVTASPLNFGTIGLLTAAIPGTSMLGVQCSNTTPYNVGLDAGQNSSGNITARKMVLGANSVAYQLYRDPGRTQVWGNIVGSNTVAGAGTGSTQSLTVYGNVPAQSTPPAGTYNDTIVVMVTY